MTTGITELIGVQMSGYAVDITGCTYDDQYIDDDNWNALSTTEQAWIQVSIGCRQCDSTEGYILTAEEDV